MAVPFASLADEAAARAFFERRPDGWKLFRAIAEAVGEAGPVTITATKSRVCLLGRTRFLHCPQAHLDGHLFIRFLVPFRIQSPRLREDDMGGRWSYRVKLKELDDEAVAWFRAAYETDAL
ncbi:MAG: DUF5655 domain-containing protein [Thermoplasmatota archaeon]